MSVLRTMKIAIARRSRRVSTNWPARYLASREEPWIGCRVVNLSLDGAALDIAVPPDEPTGRLTLALHDEDGLPLGLELQADVLWWENGSAPGYLRIGVQFADMTRLQRYALAGLTSKQRQRKAERS
jgi:hypothetical protein